MHMEEKDKVSYRFDAEVVAKKMRWHKISMTGDIPAPRECHSGCYINGKIYFFGGETEGEVQSDDLFKVTLNKSQLSPSQSKQKIGQAEPE